MLIPAMIQVTHQAIPARCRNPRRTEDTWVETFELVELTAADAPLICRTRDLRMVDACHEEFQAAGDTFIAWRRCGDICLRESAKDLDSWLKELDDDLVRHGRGYTVSEKRWDAATEWMTVHGKSLVNACRLVDGVLYDVVPEPAWHIGEDRRYDGHDGILAVRIRPGEEDKGFRLDEADEVQRRARQMIDEDAIWPSHWLRQKHPGIVTQVVMGQEVVDLDPTQLRRPKGFALVNAQRLPAVRGWSANDEAREAIARITADFLPDGMPEGVIQAMAEANAAMDRLARVLGMDIAAPRVFSGREAPRCGPRRRAEAQQEEAATAAPQCA